MEKTNAQGPRNEIWWKAISSVKFVQFFKGKMALVVIERYFPLFLKGFEDFS